MVRQRLINGTPRVEYSTLFGENAIGVAPLFGQHFPCGATTAQHPENDDQPSVSPCVLYAVAAVTAPLASLPLDRSVVTSVCLTCNVWRTIVVTSPPSTTAAQPSAAPTVAPLPAGDSTPAPVPSSFTFSAADWSVSSFSDSDSEQERERADEVAQRQAEAAERAARERATQRELAKEAAASSLAWTQAPPVLANLYKEEWIRHADAEASSSHGRVLSNLSISLADLCVESDTAGAHTDRLYGHSAGDDGEDDEDGASATVDPRAAGLQASAPDSGPDEEWAGETYARHPLTGWLSFTSALSALPHVIVRYGGKRPLVPSRQAASTVLATTGGGAAPTAADDAGLADSSALSATCPRCSSPWRFELQYLPALITEVGSMESQALGGPSPVDGILGDWATIVVFSCSKNCAPRNAFSVQTVPTLTCHAEED